MSHRIAGLLSLALIAALPAAAADSAELVAENGAGRIVRLSPVGAVVATVTASGFSPRWSPDGSRVAFRRTGELLVAELGGDTRRVWAATTKETYAKELVWSPDGAAVAFLRATPDAGDDIFTVPATGGSSRRLTATGGYKRDLAWQPGGRLLLYDWSPDLAKNPKSKPSTGIWVVDSVTAASRQIGATTRSAAWSPDGSEVALAGLGWGTEPIAVYAADGTLRRSIAKGSGPISGLAWSPDGSRIVFVLGTVFHDLFSKFGTPILWDVYAVDTDGSHLVRLTGVEGDAVCNWRRRQCEATTETLRSGSGAARWWPGGHRLFFVHGRQSESDLWTMNADGTCKRRFTTAERVLDPVWSPLAPPQPAVDCESADLRIRWAGESGGLRGGVRLSVLVRNDGTRSLAGARLVVEASRGRIEGTSSLGDCTAGVKLVCTLGALAPGTATRVDTRAYGATAPLAGLTYRAHVAWDAQRAGPAESDSELVTVYFDRCDDVGTRRSDRLVGTPKPERICGREGADRIHGLAGDDVLDGGDGADTIAGGTGRDVIYAGAGRDVVNVRDGELDTVDCDAGSDRVVADAQDRLRSCERVSRK